MEVNNLYTAIETWDVVIIDDMDGMSTVETCGSYSKALGVLADMRALNPGQTFMIVLCSEIVLSD